MKIFQEASNQMAFLKAGIFGGAGSGKSYTSSLFAIGLVKYISEKKPVLYFDTETGSDFVLHLFKDAGINLFTTKTRAFADLPPAIDEAEKEASVLIIDSITHVWNELIESYLKKNEKKRLTLRDWQPLKQTWHEFSNRYINSKLHIIWCSRSADLWEEVEDSEDGSKELRKTGTKPRTEGELGYEPSLLIELEPVQLSPRTGSSIIHRAFVKKDRFDCINGKIFDDPNFDSILPHIKLLNLGGEHKALEPDRNSTDMFEKGNTGEQKMVTRDIMLEKIGNEIKLLYPSQSETDKTARIKFMGQIFGTNSWTEIEKRRNIDELTIGLDAIKAISAEKQKFGKPKKGGKHDTMAEA